MANEAQAAQDKGESFDPSKIVTSMMNLFDGALEKTKENATSAEDVEKIDAAQQGMRQISGGMQTFMSSMMRVTPETANQLPPSLALQQTKPEGESKL